MNYLIRVSVLMAAFFVGAHSQVVNPTFVTSIEVNGTTYFGRVHLRTGSQLWATASADNDGNVYIYLDMLPGGVWETAHKDGQ